MRRQVDECLSDEARRRDPVFFDVGANVGQTTRQFLAGWRNAAHMSVYCFEPFAANFSALQRATRHAANVHAFQLALSDTTGTARVPLAPHSQWHSIANQAEWRARGGQDEDIVLSTLDVFSEQHSIPFITLLKTDTEGHDLEVLRGGRSLLAAQRVGLVICEVGFNPEDKQHSYFPLIFAELSAHGYRLCHLDDQMVYRSEMWGGVPSVGYANAWFVPGSACRPRTT